MFKVSELARRTGVTAETIRHYTHLGLLQPIRDPNNGYQLFTESDIHCLHFVLKAKQLGFTLKEIGEIARDARRVRSPCPQVREIIEARIEKNRKQIIDLQALQMRMEKALASWQTMPDGIPDGDSVCHLIESVVDLDLGATPRS